jgi:hypothetical protein
MSIVLKSPSCISDSHKHSYSNKLHAYSASGCNSFPQFKLSIQIPVDEVSMNTRVAGDPYQSIMATFDVEFKMKSISV